MKVLVTDPIADAGIERLRAADAEVETKYELDDAELLDAIADAEGLIVRSGTDVTESVFEAAENLVVVARAGIGVDNVDIEAATKHGVVVANAPEGNVRAAAEHTVAMAFAAARSIPQAHSRLVEGEWAKGEFLGTELGGKTLGVVGLGRVGQEVARRLDALGMDVVAFDPYIGEERAAAVGAGLVELEACLDQADFLTVHTPLTPETEGLISDAELDRLAGGYLINCARGGVVDEAALAAAVADGTLRGAAVDVFADEPVSADNPLLSVENVTVTPHLGASTEAAQENVAVDAAEAVLAAVEGRPVATALNAPSIDDRAFDRLRPYVDLVRTAGTLAAHLLTARPASVEVAYEGDLADEDIEFLTASALTGVFDHTEWQVNPVNAPRVAAERGVDVTESRSPRTEDFQSLVRITVGDGEDEVAVEGTLFTENEPRIVRIDGYRVDAIPAGHVLVARNRDEPGVIGFIGTVLGEEGLNIAGMFNARETRGGEALTVYNLDEPIDDDTLHAIEADERIVEAQYVALNGQDA